MSKESQGPSLGVHLIEVSVKRELTVFPWLHDIRSMSYDKMIKYDNMAYDKMLLQWQNNNDNPSAGKC